MDTHGANLGARSATRSTAEIRSSLFDVHANVTIGLHALDVGAHSGGLRHYACGYCVCALLARDHQKTIIMCTAGTWT